MSVSQVAPDVFVTVARTGVLVRGHAGGLRVHTAITEPPSLTPASLGQRLRSRGRLLLHSVFSSCLFLLLISFISPGCSTILSILTRSLVSLTPTGATYGVRGVGGDTSITRKGQDYKVAAVFSFASYFLPTCFS